MCPSNRPLGLADSETHTNQNPRLSLYKNVRLCCSNLLELSKFIIVKATILRGVCPLAYVYMCVYACCACVCWKDACVDGVLECEGQTSTSPGFPSHFSPFGF